jgi:hypothetical protein
MSKLSNVRVVELRGCSDALNEGICTRVKSAYVEETCPLHRLSRHRVLNVGHYPIMSHLIDWG